MKNRWRFNRFFFELLIHENKFCSFKRTKKSRNNSRLYSLVRSWNASNYQWMRTKILRQKINKYNTLSWIIKISSGNRRRRYNNNIHIIIIFSYRFIVVYSVRDVSFPSVSLARYLKIIKFFFFFPIFYIEIIDDLNFVLLRCSINYSRLYTRISWKVTKKKKKNHVSAALRFNVFLFLWYRKFWQKNHASQKEKTRLG